MELEQMRQLVAIDEAGTISAAAERLHLSQPALSRSIQRLETELGQPLVDRSGRRAELNQAGRLALDYARQMLRDERLMREALADLARREHVLTVATVAPAPLWRLTALLVERFPQTVLTSETLDEGDVEQRVINNEVGFGISLRPVMLPNVRSTRLMTESLSVSLPASHPLAGAATLSSAELDGETFLLFNQIGFWRGYCDRCFKRSRFVVQEDRTVFEQLARTSDLPYFVSDAPSAAFSSPEGRVTVPFRDTSAHATFYLLVNVEARAEAQEAFDWIARA